jgi:hypothetical protein
MHLKRLISRRIVRTDSPGLAQAHEVWEDLDGREVRVGSLVDPREVNEFPPSKAPDDGENDSSPRA